jgi:hypothetical protein
MPRSNARYSAAVSAIRGVAIRSMAGVYEELGLLERDAHRREHDGELLSGPQHGGLSRDLCGEAVMREPGDAEYRELLSADQRIEPVDGGDAGLDELGGVVTGVGVGRGAVDVALLVGDDPRQAVDRLAEAVEDAPQDVGAHAEEYPALEEPGPGVEDVDPRGGLEELDEGLVLVDLEDLALADRAVRQLQLRKLLVRHLVDAPDDDERPHYLLYGRILLEHVSAPAFHVRYQSRYLVDDCRANLREPLQLALWHHARPRYRFPALHRD